MVGLLCIVSPVLAVLAFFAWEMVRLRRLRAFVERFNARDPEAIAAWLPSGHHYDPETRCVTTDTPGQLPYRLPELVLSP